MKNWNTSTIVIAAFVAGGLAFWLVNRLTPPAAPPQPVVVGTMNPTPTPAPSQQPAIHTTGCTPKSLTILEPASGATVHLPFTVRARVDNRANPNCHWPVFEAVAGPVELKDATGATVATGRLETTEDWMTDGPVNFTATVTAQQPVTGAVKLVLTDDNPSGRPDPQTITIPLIAQ